MRTANDNKFYSAIKGEDLENKVKLKLFEIRTHSISNCKRLNKIHPTTAIQHEIAVANISLTKITQEN
jgi:hypothetical protein